MQPGISTGSGTDQLGTSGRGAVPLPCPVLSTQWLSNFQPAFALLLVQPMRWILVTHLRPHLLSSESSRHPGFKKTGKTPRHLYRVYQCFNPPWYPFSRNRLRLFWGTSVCQSAEDGRFPLRWQRRARRESGTDYWSTYIVGNSKFMGTGWRSGIQSYVGTEGKCYASCLQKG